MDKPRTALKRTCCTPFPARLETSENRDLHTCMCLCVCSHACMYVCMSVIYWHLPKAWDALPSVNIQKLNKLLLEGWAKTGGKEKAGVEYQNIKNLWLRKRKHGCSKLPATQAQGGQETVWQPLGAVWWWSPSARQEPVPSVCSPCSRSPASSEF